MNNNAGISHTNYYPMTIIQSPFFYICNWNQPKHNYYIYNAWFFKTIELDEVKIILPLN